MSGTLRRAGAGIVASFCLEGGVLSGKYPHGQAPGRAAAGMLDEHRVAPALAAARDLACLAERLETSSAALALAFPLAGPAVASVLFGATSPEQLRANCAAASLLERIAPDDLAELKRIGSAQAGDGAQRAGPTKGRRW